MERNGSKENMGSAEKHYCEQSRYCEASRTQRTARNLFGQNDYRGSGGENKFLALRKRSKRWESRDLPSDSDTDSEIDLMDDLFLDDSPESEDSDLSSPQSAQMKSRRHSGGLEREELSNGSKASAASGRMNNDERGARPEPSEAKRLLILYATGDAPPLANDRDQIRDIYLKEPEAIFGECPYEVTVLDGKLFLQRKEPVGAEKEKPEAENNSTSELKSKSNKSFQRPSSSQLPSSQTGSESGRDPQDKTSQPGNENNSRIVSRGFCSACKARVREVCHRKPSFETNDKILARRKKTILSVKCSWRYKRYVAIVPKEVRPPDYPSTPDIKQKHSRSSWMLTVKQWRTDLIMWELKDKDPPRTKKEQFNSVLELMQRKTEEHTEQ